MVMAVIGIAAIASESDDHRGVPAILAGIEPRRSIRISVIDILDEFFQSFVVVVW